MRHRNRITIEQSDNSRRGDNDSSMLKGPCDCYSLMNHQSIRNDQLGHVTGRKSVLSTKAPFFLLEARAVVYRVGRVSTNA